MKILYQGTIEQKKKVRSRKVERIIVEVDGIPFDGDETSQGRMTRAVLVLDPLEATLWMCADNVPRVVTREQFRQALRLAGEAQTQVWFL
jgi:hypothetical protein